MSAVPSPFPALRAIDSTMMRVRRLKKRFATTYIWKWDPKLDIHPVIQRHLERAVGQSAQGVQGDSMKSWMCEESCEVHSVMDRCRIGGALGGALDMAHLQHLGVGCLSCSSRERWYASIDMLLESL